ncbi:Crp/Fnr family transcriptional regulator [Flavobacterium sp. JP2137]|uniref:Crp/Fnr family transcriptional regulator n=1 Tax=Flavobacterium sp. JP2137 TaxID=3414510 RepID=UPI003D2FE4BD
MFERIDLKAVVDPVWIEKYQSFFTEKTLPPKTVLLEQGQMAEAIYWIQKGCIRAWINHQGQEVTFQFFMEGSLVASMESFWKGKPSALTIETIEPCVVWVADKNAVQILIEEVLEQREFRNLFIDAIFDRTFDYMQHSLSFIQLTPEQRYVKLLEERPELIRRIAQHYIASYLGISSVHLSRIKGKWAKK